MFADLHPFIGKKRRKVICAPASFKETLSAQEVAQAMAQGIARADPEAIIDICPVGDGGEGTMHVLAHATGAAIHQAQVTGPLGERVEADYAVSRDGKTAIVEMAQACGLALVPTNRRDPTRTTSFGAGEPIALAVARRCEQIIVCIGGSATVDGGAGIAQALGAKFFDRAGNLIPSPITGGALLHIARIEPASRALPKIRVACDVTNPLCGPNGAATVYGPQKGATPQQVQLLDRALAHFASICKTFSAADPNQPGSGAAGGAGFGLASLCGATLERGIELVLDTMRFRERCAGAWLVLTGEGRLDSQSLHGKAALGVAASAAHAAGGAVPTIAIVGSTGTGAELAIGRASAGRLTEYISLAERFGTKRSMAEPAVLIAQVTAELVQRRLGGSG